MGKVQTKSAAALILTAGFDAKDIRCLGIKDPTNQIWAYTNDYKGKSYFHIRQVYQTEDGAWHPGKGLSMPGEKKDSFIKALTAD